MVQRDMDVVQIMDVGCLRFKEESVHLQGSTRIAGDWTQETLHDASLCAEVVPG